MASKKSLEERIKEKDERMQIDHRSYKRQGLEKEPGIHEGVTARKMEVDGHISERCEYNREISERNSIRESLAQMAKEIIAFIIEKVRELYERIGKLTGADRDFGKTGRDDLFDGGASGEGSAALIRDIRSTINVAAGAEKNSGAERKNREAEQRRLDLERQREIERRNIRRKSRGIDR